MDLEPRHQSAARDRLAPFPSLTLSCATALTIGLLLWQGYGIYGSYRNLSDLANFDLTLTGLAGDILYYDEALTMSARVNTTPHRNKFDWEGRYTIYEQELAAALQRLEGITLAAGYEYSVIEETRSANEKLLEMEKSAFEMVKSGRTAHAGDILFSPDYEAQKERYTAGIKKLLGGIKRAIEKRLAEQKNTTRSHVLGMVFSVLSLIGAWGLALKNTRTWRRALERSYEEERLAKRTIEESFEALQTVNDELERFNYVVAHDLKEPLRSIHSFAQLAEEHNQDPSVQSHLDVIKRCCLRLSQIIDDLLSYAKLGKTNLREEYVDCNDIVAYIVAEQLSPAVGETNAAVIYENLPVLWTDKMKFILLMQNLISNGLKYNDSKNPRVFISAAKQNGFWIFEVRDNGIGIPHERHHDIFELFIRLHDRRQYKGTGIGLAICKRLLDRLGGRIWVESNEGQGSRFFFSLPALQPPPHQ